MRVDAGGGGAVYVQGGIPSFLNCTFTTSAFGVRVDIGERMLT
jgi:hypothetical protein